VLDLISMTRLWCIGTINHNFAVHLIFYRSNTLEANIAEISDVPLSSAVNQSVDEGMTFKKKR
jgi:hypothetical protein